MSGVYLVGSDLFKKLWDLMDYLEDNTQKLIDNNSNITVAKNIDEDIVQKNIDTLIKIFNDVQNIKEDLRKVIIQHLASSKAAASMLYAGTQVFDDISDKLVLPEIKSELNKEIIN